MTGLVEYENDAPRYSLVRDGVSGNIDVLWQMIQIVRDTVVKDKGFEDFIKQLIVDNGYDSYTNVDTLFNFLYDFVKQHVSYVQDIAGKTESIKDARTTLQDGYGDCDDMAILNASILAVLGYEPCFVIGKYPESDSFQHVYTATYVNGKRYVFDTTIPDGRLNSEVKEMQTVEFGIFDERPETDGIASVFRNLKYLFLHTKRNVNNAVPLLSGFLPIGLLGKVVTSALFAGANDEAKLQSVNALGSSVSTQLADIIIELQNGRLAIELAQSQANQAYNTFITNIKDHETDAYKSIDKRLQDKLNYINSYGSIGDNVITLNTTLMKYLGIGIVGVGIYWLFTKN